MKLLDWISWVVPSDRRDAWLAEWRGELWELARRQGSRERRPLAHRAESLGFVLGAVPHAIWERKEEWTLDGIAQDLRFATRALLRAPVFTLIGTLTLGLGLSANAAIFSMVNGIFFRPPGGLEDPQRLAHVGRGRDRLDTVSHPLLEALEQEPAFSGVAAQTRTSLILGSGPESAPVSARLVSGRYFEVLGVRAFAGRLIGPEDTRRPGDGLVAVISETFWRRHFGADPTVVGRVVPVNGQPFQIVGIAAGDFSGLQAVATPPEVWIPYTMSHLRYPRSELWGHWGTSWLRAVARLAPGVEIEQARASLELLAARLESEDPQNRGLKLAVAPDIGLLPDERREGAVIAAVFVGIAGLVLLVTSASVANLVLARSSGRSSEMGIRAALGAGRSRILRQIVSEALLLSLLGAGVGVAGGYLARNVVPALLPYTFAVSFEPDLRVVAFTLAAALIAAMVFGSIPALRASRGSVVSVLKAGAGEDRRGSWLRHGVVVAQLAMSLALLSGAGMLVRSALNVANADPGFSADDVVVASIDLDASGTLDDDRGLSWFRHEVEALARLPAVASVTVADGLAIADAMSTRTLRPDPGDPHLRIAATSLVVGSGYFETMGMALRRGRDLSDASAWGDGPPEVVVNESFATLAWPGEDPVGRSLPMGPGLTEHTVVGVVADARLRSLRLPPRPAVFHPLGHSYQGGLTFHLRLQAASGEAGALTEIARALQAAAPGIPLRRVGTFSSLLRASEGETRGTAVLLIILAVIALALAAIGLYGVMAFQVGQRTREIGLRLALGAQRGELISMVLARGARLAAAGILLGLLLSYAMGSALRSLLFGVSTWDAPTLLATSAVLGVVALLASYAPARRAAGLDAVISLREG